jgi:hypothetical protein
MTTIKLRNILQTDPNYTAPGFDRTLCRRALAAMGGDWSRYNLPVEEWIRKTTASGVVKPEIIEFVKSTVERVTA